MKEKAAVEPPVAPAPLHDVERLTDERDDVRLAVLRLVRTPGDDPPLGVHVGQLGRTELTLSYTSEVREAAEVADHLGAELVDDGLEVGWRDVLAARRLGEVGEGEGVGDVKLLLDRSSDESSCNIALTRCAFTCE